ncbi:hypothetical protein DRJ48_03565 [Candidatus Woesearchaeota archaeon]|nr:hypothetical protein [Candidatus Woesearchaeota archaeon]RLE42413.1 MAG: hypothetical protein DRJ48_03565 [Candidatus Woesearchaeota archaeon]
MLEDMDTADVIQLVISFLLRGALIAGIITSVLTKHWSLFFIALLALIVSLLPVFIERNGKIFLPIEFELVITGFVFASLFLGEGFRYYDKFWWWDLMLHAASGLILGFVGFLIVYTFLRGGKVKMSPVLVAIFSFSFALALGALWEIFEFTLDSAFNFNAQHNSLVDTMWDLIVDAFGGLAASIIGYYYVKGGDTLLFNRLVKKFIRENPWWFR